MRTRSCSSRLDRRGLAQAGGAAGRGAGVQTHEASGARRLAGVTRGVLTAGARTVPVEDAEESHSLLAPLWPKRVADATAVLVYLRGGLALTHARLNAVARVRANGLEREGQQGLRLDDAHLRAAREKHQKKALEASPIHASGVARGRGARTSWTSYALAYLLLLACHPFLAPPAASPRRLRPRGAGL